MNLRVRSAFKNETAELANQTRRLGRGVRELAETSPQLREVVRALSGRVDGLKAEGEVSDNIQHRLDRVDDGKKKTEVGAGHVYCCNMLSTLTPSTSRLLQVFLYAHEITKDGMDLVQMLVKGILFTY